ncbi:MAG: protein disulfide oxidoreductase [Pseudomonadota bacterium]
MSFIKRVLPYLFVGALLAGGQLLSSRSLITGTPPPIEGPLLDGMPFSLADFRGRPGVVYFWASWCGICRAMQGTMNSVAGDFQIVSVALQSGDALEVRRHMTKEGITLPVILDETGKIGTRYGIRGVPALFVLGADSEIKFASAGYTSELGLRLRLWLAGLE